jgi:hypothetical protein
VQNKGSAANQENQMETTEPLYHDDIRVGMVVRRRTEPAA